ncbi:CMP/dCMP deaminase zinc-binding protein [Catenovulum agarivorans DS-2]|uniref:CMP/dCMP deaminase zinc-binding protein n=1 Tax=Catenovulum agarivorans DS-2 TaxID=1328313 RepID=W7QIN6_9ALTE|nr:anti-phage dCTP deaminase [Catenovulum agarivorans]EWH08787.1 CMP/dCMP deaminase zinc-binding protein [Catenovulum agarivorans DS-2]
MAKPASKITNLAQQSPVQSENPTTIPTVTTIKQRRSQELIIGLCGTVGSGVRSLQKTLATKLKESGYYVEHIRLSDLIISSQDDPKALENLSGFERYDTLQNHGDELRKKHGGSILAELAIRKITISRETNFGSGESQNVVRNQKKAAYIIDQLKHPDEIDLFKEAYRNNFYLLGLLRTENERRSNLKEEQISDSEIGQLIERDRKASQSHGQHVEKSLHKSDYFIRNMTNDKAIGESVIRFIKLIHGTELITPTKDETGIYSAYSASLKSACLSRQVGAAICDDDGNIIATGCNDVPRFGGGLYNAESPIDQRCFNYGRKCYNDSHKLFLKKEIEQILQSNNVSGAPEIATQILEESKAKSIIEYSRAIHAEMDAITTIARNPNTSTVGKTLYCTTYPCHVCARHIVASGIKRVVYIEPYEKSLATSLHGDTIYHPDNQTNESKVLLENFEGVSPLRYSKFFKYSQRRKNSSGELIDYIVTDSGHVDFQHLDGYGDYELKIVDLVNEKIPDSE